MKQTFNVLFFIRKTKLKKSDDTPIMLRITIEGQLVEQRTENPCVPGSIPGGTTQKRLQIWKIPETLWFQGFFFPRNPPFLAKLGNSLGLNRGHFLPLKN